MTDIPDEIMKRARECVSRIVEAIEPRHPGYAQEIRDGKRDADFDVEIKETARALMEAAAEAEARGRKHGPMLCTSCGTVASTDRCDCTDQGMERLSMRVRYIDFLLAEEQRAEARGRAKGMEEAAKVAEDMVIDAMGPYSVQEAIATAIRAKAGRE